jgi:hypothetical protein
MEATGSLDGRDVVVALDEVRKLSGIERTPDGRYKMAAAKTA